MKRIRLALIVVALALFSALVGVHLADRPGVVVLADSITDDNTPWT